MKLRKKVLDTLKIYNSYDIARKVGNNIFIEYIPHDNGRLTSHYAYWNFIRLGEYSDKLSLQQIYYHKDFTVTHREVKESVLQEVITYVKTKYGINITDKDVFGSYHPEGTLEKLENLVRGVSHND